MGIKKGCLILMTLDLCILMGLLFLHHHGGWGSRTGENINRETETMSLAADREDSTDREQASADREQTSTNGEQTSANEKQINTDSYKGKIAITFDDGPYPKYTKALLDGLKERNVKATFFVIGESAEKYPDVIKRMSEEGHLIGNHTYHHVELTAVGTETFKEELRSTSELLYEITGEYPEFIRPPFGAWSKSLESELGMIPVLWSVDPLDWQCTDARCVAENVLSSVEENDIILMHDCYESSVEAAFTIIDELKKQGYEFVTVDEILFD